MIKIKFGNLAASLHRESTRSATVRRDGAGDVFVVAEVLYAVVPALRGGRYGPGYGGQALSQYQTCVVPFKPVEWQVQQGLMILTERLGWYASMHGVKRLYTCTWGVVSEVHVERYIALACFITLCYSYVLVLT